MYTSLQLLKKYIRYYLSASNAKGHAVHSPFVFEFIKFIKNDKTIYPYYNKIEAIRKKLLHDNSIITVEDFGAGSSIIKTNNRIVKKMASSSLKQKKYSRLLQRMVQYYDKKTVLELGTSFGVTTSYIAFANNNPIVTTIEGSKNIATIAQQNFDKLGLKNINLITGDFEKKLPVFLKKIDTLHFVFIDGNHRKEPTLNYFKLLLTKINNDTIVVFDDIHWSKEMESAWYEIKDHETVMLSIDLFFIGIIFFKKEFLVKQHFVIRY